MSQRDRPVVIVQQSQSQWQTQNAEGCGCAGLVGLVILIGLLATLVEAMRGEHGLGWQIGSISGVVIVGLLVIGGIVGWLAQKFSWGKGNEEGFPSERDPQGVVDEADNYGVATTPARRLGRRLPHPDDPPARAEDEPLEEVSVAPAGEAVPRPDVYDQIRRLAGLRDEGLITEEEFEAKKRELLDRL